MLSGSITLAVVRSSLAQRDAKTNGESGTLGFWGPPPSPTTILAVLLVLVRVLARGLVPRRVWGRFGESNGVVALRANDQRPPGMVCDDSPPGRTCAYAHSLIDLFWSRAVGDCDAGGKACGFSVCTLFMEQS